LGGASFFLLGKGATWITKGFVFNFANLWPRKENKADISHKEEQKRFKDLYK
jgi:hypothetical protein